MRASGLLLALIAGCYSPTAPAGAPCSDTGDCPASQACIAGACGGSIVDDAALADAHDLDAPIDGVPPIDAPPATPPAFRAASKDKGAGGSRSISLPQGTAPGDFLVAHVSMDNHNAVELPTPAGWIRLAGIDNGEDFSAVVLVAIAGNNAPSTLWTFPSGNTNYNAVAISAFAGVDPVNPINAFATLSSEGVTTTTPSTPSIVTTVASTRLVALFTLDGVNEEMAAPTGMTEIYNDIVTGTGLPFEGCHAAFAGPGATGARTGTVATAGLSIGILVALAPE